MLCIALHCFALHCFALLSFALHCFAFHFGAEEPGSGGLRNQALEVKEPGGGPHPQGTRGREAFLKALLKAKQRRQQGDTAPQDDAWSQRSLGIQGFWEDIALEPSKDPFRQSLIGE